MKTWYEEIVSDEHVNEILNLPTEMFEEYTADMIEFYRDHPIEAVYDLIGLKLTEYQKVIFEESWYAKNIYLCQSRGSGKSFLMALYACLYALLYPNESILMLAPSFRQSLMLFDKIISDVYNRSFSLRYEMPKKGLRKGTMEASITFLNHTKIKFLPVGDGNKIRGERATFLILDEHAQHDEVMIDRVIMPMLVADLNYDPENPQDGFQPKVLIATSAYFQFNHSYKEFQAHLHRMEEDDDYYSAVIPYEIPLEVGLYNSKFVEKQKKDMSQDDFEMEMGCRWIAGNENSFIPVQAWDKGIRYEEMLEPLFAGDPEKQYVLFADIAREEGGDNASLMIGEIRGNKLAVVREIALNGQPYQIIRDHIRKILIKFNVIDIWMDKLGGGTMVRDLLDEEWTDFDTGKTYPPILEVDKQNRTDGIKLITFIVADNALNHHMGHLAKKHIEKKHYIFPKLMDRHPEKEMEMAYLDLIMIKKEVTNIQATPSGNFHKFLPTKGSRLKKDRWTTFCYSALYLEEKLNSVEEDDFYMEVF